MRFPVANPVLGKSELKYLQKCLDSNWISSSGALIAQFEEKFAEAFGPGKAVATNSGTMALDLAFHSLELSPGDEVIVPDFTFAGSVSPVCRAQAVPVYCPPAKEHWNMDLNALEPLINSRTKAILAVHLYGQPCDMVKVMQIAKKYDLKVIEDCAEALGAKVNGQKVGTFGDIACFSFFANKVLTTGEGGLCLTRSEEWLEKLLLYRDHGMLPNERYWHRVIGFNGRMTNLQAAVGCGQLESVHEMIEKRKQIHCWYQDVFSDESYFFPIKKGDHIEDVNWLESPVLRPECSLNRDQLCEELLKEGIDTRPFFYPLSSMPAYDKFGTTHANALFFSSHGFNLPTYTSLSKKDVHWIAKKVVELLSLQYKEGSGVTCRLKIP